MEYWLLNKNINIDQSNNQKLLFREESKQLFEVVIH